MKRARWEHIEHDADIGIRATAGSRERLFEAMAEALTAIITEPDGVECPELVEIGCTAPDDALLLADWLNALVFEMATRNMVFGDWQVELQDHELRARVWGETVDREKHKPVVEVKGATYTALSVRPESDGTWTGQCVVDV